MAEPYWNRGAIKYIDLPLRADFLKGGPDPFQDAPARLTLHRLDENGVASEEPLQTVEFARLQAFSMPQDERLQYVINSVDNGKVYFFGRMHRVYLLNAFLVDTDLTQVQKDALTVRAGDTLSLWNALYGTYLRASKAVEQSLVTRVSFMDMRIWGLVMASSISGSSDNDNLVTLGISLFSLWEENNVSMPILEMRDLQPEAFPALLTKEGSWALFAGKGGKFVGITSKVGKKAETGLVFG